MKKFCKPIILFDRSNSMPFIKTSVALFDKVGLNIKYSLHTLNTMMPTLDYSQFSPYYYDYYLLLLVKRLQTTHK